MRFVSIRPSPGARALLDEPANRIDVPAWMVREIRAGLRRLRARGHRLGPTPVAPIGTATGSFTTMSQALLAQESLGAKLQGMPWLRGIGITSAGGPGSTLGDDGYALKVNVQSDAARALVPMEVMGVMVFTDVVGDIRPLSSTKAGAFSISEWLAGKRDQLRSAERRGSSGALGGGVGAAVGLLLLGASAYVLLDMWIGKRAGR